MGKSSPVSVSDMICALAELGYAVRFEPEPGLKSFRATIRDARHEIGIAEEISVSIDASHAASGSIDLIRAFLDRGARHCLGPRAFDRFEVRAAMRAVANGDYGR